MDENLKATLITIVREGGIGPLNAFCKQHPNCLSEPLCSRGFYAIHYAAREGHLHLVRFILRRKPAQINELDGKSSTPLLHAVSRNHTAVVEYLLSKNADYLAMTKSEDGQMRTVIDWALHLEFWGCLKLLHQQQTKAMQTILLEYQGIDLVLFFQFMFEAIVFQNAHALSWLLFETPHFNKLELEQQFKLIEMADSILEPRVLYNFLDPRCRLDSPQGNSILLKEAVKRGLNNLLGLLVLNTITIPHKKNIDQFIALAPTVDDKYIHNLLIAVIFRNFQKASRYYKNPSMQKWNCESLFRLYLRSKRQIIELAAMNKLIVPYLEKSPHVQTILLPETTAQSYSKFYPPNQRRRYPIYAEVAPQSLKIYHREHVIGKGTYGRVERFTNSKTGAAVAVKYVEQSWNNDIVEDTNAEATFITLMQPGRSIHTFFSPEGSQGIVKNRIVMPCFSGVPLSRMIDSVTTAHDFAELILKVSEKLDHFHRIGCIHGDVKEENFMVSKDANGFTVELIDFGFSSYRDETQAFYFPKKVDEMFAPEINAPKITTIIPHPRTDIYSLGDMYNYLLGKSPVGEAVCAAYPCIRIFCEQALKVNPEERPQSLRVFCKELSEAIKEIKAANAAPSCSAPC